MVTAAEKEAAKNVSVAREAATRDDSQAAAESGAPRLASGKVVKYIGLSDIREIDHQSWKNVGSDNAKIVWDKKNKWMVPIDLFDDAALLYCDEDDAEFVIVDAPIDRVRELRGDARG